MLRHGICQNVLSSDCLTHLRFACGGLKSLHSGSTSKSNFVWAVFPEISRDLTSMARKPSASTSKPSRATPTSKTKHNARSSILKAKNQNKVIDSSNLVPLAAGADRFLFKERLLRGTVLSRPNRFCMEVDVNGIGVCELCHLIAKHGW